MIATIKSMGLLRNGLHVLALLLVCILPFSEPSWHPQGVDIILAGVVPALAPIVSVLIMFDVLMCSVQKADAQEEDSKALYAAMIKVHLLVAGLLTAFWLYAFWGALFN